MRGPRGVFLISPIHTRQRARRPLERGAEQWKRSSSSETVKDGVVDVRKLPSEVSPSRWIPAGLYLRNPVRVHSGTSRIGYDYREEGQMRLG